MLLASHGQMMAVDAIKQLSHLIGFRLPMVILEIHYLPESFMRIDRVGSPLALNNKAE
jgi:hypothetical protein